MRTAKKDYDYPGPTIVAHEVLGALSVADLMTEAERRGVELVTNWRGELAIREPDAYRIAAEDRAAVDAAELHKIEAAEAEAAKIKAWTYVIQKHYFEAFERSKRATEGLGDIARALTETSEWVQTAVPAPYRAVGLYRDRNGFGVPVDPKLLWPDYTPPRSVVGAAVLAGLIGGKGTRSDGDTLATTFGGLK